MKSLCLPVLLAAMDSPAVVYAGECLYTCMGTAKVRGFLPAIKKAFR